MPTKPELQKLPAPKLKQKGGPSQQPIGVVKLTNGSFTKIGQVTKEIKAHTEDDYLCVVKLKGQHVLGHVYRGEEKILPSSITLADWQGARFIQL